MKKTYLFVTTCIIPEEGLCIYFLRTTDGMVPLVNNAEDANIELPDYFEMGIQNGHSLIQLQQLIRDV